MLRGFNEMKIEDQPNSQGSWGNEGGRKQMTEKNKYWEMITWLIYQAGKAKVNFVNAGIRS